MIFTTREEVMAMTPLWKGERFEDGRPKVADRYLDALACHASQFFEFLPVDMGLNASEVPPRDDRAAVRSYLAKWFAPIKRTDAERFKDRLAEWYGAAIPRNVEAFEVSRYGRQLSESELRELFGMRGK